MSSLPTIIIRCKLSSPFDLNPFVNLWFHISGNTDLLWPYSEMSLRTRNSLLAHSCSIFNIFLAALVRAVTAWSTVRQQRSVHAWVCHRVLFVGWSNEILTYSEQCNDCWMCHLIDSLTSEMVSDTEKSGQWGTENCFWHLVYRDGSWWMAFINGVQHYSTPT